MNEFKVSYVTTLPKDGNAPRVTISGPIPAKYKVMFFDYGVGMVSSGYCNTNQTILAKAKQWYTDWYIRIEDESQTTVYEEHLELRGKTVFVKIDGFALGDNIAWMPYIEEFRKHHNCNMICSTFHNYLFTEAYPNVLFVKPNTVIENVYAQYYIGASNEDNPYYSPVKSNFVPLQMVASEILGLKYREIRPDLTKKYKLSQPRFDSKYVTLSEFGSTPAKEWKAENGWQQVVDFLVGQGYKVLVISREPTTLQNIVDLTGDISLEERAVDIYHAKYHFGISSGLSWLAWGLHTPVVMISDVTPKWHEFVVYITRFSENESGVVNYEEIGQTKVETVLEKLADLTS